MYIFQGKSKRCCFDWPWQRARDKHAHSHTRHSKHTWIMAKCRLICSTSREIAALCANGEGKALDVFSESRAHRCMCFGSLTCAFRPETACSFPSAGSKCVCAQRRRRRFCRALLIKLKMRARVHYFLRRIPAADLHDVFLYALARN